MKKRNVIALASALAIAPWMAGAVQPHWSYTGKDNPSHWGSIEPAYASCSLGKQQSPIDIHDAHKALLAPIVFAYRASQATVVNNGHTIQVTLSDPGTVRLANEEYKLTQFHFHTPSEEAIDGKRFPMVAHLVHRNASGQLAVISVLIKQGKPNAKLAPIFSLMPSQEGKAQVLPAAFDPSNLLPAERGYYSFTGSLTTPPCSEGVRWQVMEQPIEVSTEQWQAFRNLYPMNARPLQQLYGRTVDISD
ncbi:MAG TPA: carbonic anhydrase family protein [Dyella sp.]|uniref:carbonic anhydrase n=1 Tax=Dyella sp. TaxID=1869338 RepID=UPI002F92460A